MNVQKRELADFDFRSKHFETSKDLAHDKSEKWRQYVPFEDVSENIPLMIDITYNPHRIYLKQSPEKQSSSISDLVNRNNKADIFDKFKPKEDTYNIFLLDLGTKPLQRIIDDMRSLHDRGRNTSTITSSTKKNDLVMRYCEYITDKKHYIGRINKKKAMKK